MVSGVCDGFIGNRMLEAYTKQAWYLVEEGATPEQIDRAMESFGVAMGPFRVGDLVGHDVSLAIRQRRRAERPGLSLLHSCPTSSVGSGDSVRRPEVAGTIIPKGPRRPAPSAVVEQLITAHRAEIGVRSAPDRRREIVDRLVYALVNEGARILEEGIAARASDIDVVYLTGYGFPRARGGPMFYADQMGLDRVLRRVREFAVIRMAIPPSGRRRRCCSVWRSRAAGWNTRVGRRYHPGAGGFRHPTLRPELVSANVAAYR